MLGCTSIAANRFSNLFCDARARDARAIHSMLAQKRANTGLQCSKGYMDPQQHPLIHFNGSCLPLKYGRPSKTFGRKSCNSKCQFVGWSCFACEDVLKSTEDPSWLIESQYWKCVHLFFADHDWLYSSPSCHFHLFRDANFL